MVPVAEKGTGWRLPVPPVWHVDDRDARRRLLAVALAVFVVGVSLLRLPCAASADTTLVPSYTFGCYTDVSALYLARGLSGGQPPYSASGQGVEYPVLTGAAMGLAAALANSASLPIQGRQILFFLVTLALLSAGLAAAVWFTWGTTRAGPFAALALATSPLLILTGSINWDLITVGLVAAALWAHLEQRPALTGVLIGLGIAAKLYPALLLVVVLAAAARDRAWRAATLTLGAAVGAWLLVNLPVMVAAPDAWAIFYTANRNRGPDSGSLWLALDQLGHPVDGRTVLTAAVMLVAATLAFWAVVARKAAVPQVFAGLLLVSLSVQTVYSPQYALWWLAVIVLARPRWSTVIAAGAIEVVFTAITWRHLLGQVIPPDYETFTIANGPYAFAVIAHCAALFGVGLALLLWRPAGAVQVVGVRATTSG